MASSYAQFGIPSRAASNQHYVAALDRIVLKTQMKERAFASTKEVRKAAITTRVLELVHQVVSKGIHITKRDLFYTDVKLFTKQEESDAVLDDVACLVGCTRTSLNVVASDKVLTAVPPPPSPPRALVSFFTAACFMCPCIVNRVATFSSIRAADLTDLAKGGSSTLRCGFPYSLCGFGVPGPFAGCCDWQGDLRRGRGRD